MRASAHAHSLEHVSLELEELSVYRPALEFAAADNGLKPLPRAVCRLDQTGTGLQREPSTAKPGAAGRYHGLVGSRFEGP